MIKTADHIIDLGPEGGKQGGQIMVEGTPEEIIQNDSSYTAQFLRAELK
jgi:excinuclease ABC subunit A